MSSSPIPENEFERLQKLAEYDIDYSEMHKKLDDLTRLAAYVAGTPISLVNLLGANTQWTVSNFGLDVKQTPREDTACQYVVLQSTPLEVKNMTEDDRFKDKDYVLEDPSIRYYYGVPLTTPDGYNIGAMCVLDTDIRELSPEKQEFLRIIGNEVITRIEYEHKLKLMRNNMDELKEIQRKVSHDIRGPLGGIIGIAEILKGQAKEQKMDDFMKLLELINRGGRSVLDLANDILSDYEDESEVPDHQFTLPILQGKLMDLYQPQALSKDINFSVETGEKYQKAQFPKYKLLQILGNLITNAIKFTPKDGHVNVHLSIKQEDETVSLTATVEDTGVGMNPEKIKEITSDQAKSTAGTSNERGYGFGFQLARHLTESMHGSLVVESVEGKGSKMTVEIPVD
ncbi:GAF domain-containing sensor histidine kinase [Gracilimonas mengyeensis]|uniref:histidine kinase n=1 Tax=Gracilimonas mengyeensis TaxID=1302730 RepID=A0A521EBQ3_9BACT|nr:GAF domain-containing sensor histidine kinase [Gracilimonas mengyeensis]SMO81319.1 GAF domain-containing protein [Gracilimonas mengyeensis]